MFYYTKLYTKYYKPEELILLRVELNLLPKFCFSLFNKNYLFKNWNYKQKVKYLNTII